MIHTVLGNLISVRPCADSRWSAIGFSIVSPILIAWLLTFSIGYDNVFPKSFVDKWDVRNIDLNTYWLF
jgi:hypothetical protein